MPVADLFGGDYARYFRSEADRPGVLWVFQHIPKTAGSSFGLELSERLAPAFNVHADHENLERPARETLEESLQTFIAEQPKQGYRFVTGHLRGPQIRRIRQAHRPTRFVTMLRDPVARVVSDFRYMRTPAHPNHAAVIAQYPDLSSYLEDPRSQNKMMRFLRRNAKQTVAEVIADLEQQFAFIGTLERYDASCAILFRLLGDDRPPKVHARKTESRAENQVPDLERLMGRIAALNADDLAIHAHFQGRLAAVAEGAVEWMAKHPPSSL